MRRKYEITITTTLPSPRGEGRGRRKGRRWGGKEGDWKERRMWGYTGRDGERKKDGEIMEGK